MNWITQNWLWILLAVGVFAVLGRLGRLGPRGRDDPGHHGHAANSDQDGVDHGRRDAPDGDAGRPWRPGRMTSAIDPVTRRDVATATALTSTFAGRIYFFESAETRQRFETAPEQYARAEFGRPLGTSEGDSESRHPRRHGGC